MNPSMEIPTGKIPYGVDTVVHLAARVHVMKDSASNPFAEYRKVNVMGSERLALTAAECGVKRFIFMSSVKVSGEENVRAYKEGTRRPPKTLTASVRCTRRNG